MSEKKRRKLFLQEFSAALKLSNPNDPRRSDAAIVFIAFGEKQSRAWLSQAGGDYGTWEKLLDIKKARKLASKKTANTRKATRRTRTRNTRKAKRRARLIIPAAAKNISPTFIQRDDRVELARLNTRLNGGGGLSYTRSAGLKAQIALLKDENAAPTL